LTLPMKRPSYTANTWNPFEEIRRMQEYMEKMFNSFPVLDNQFGREVLSPFVDVIEEDDKVIITTDLPGIDKDDIELSLRENSLIISAGKEKDEETKKEGYIRRERALMRYYREIPLMSGVTESGAIAQLKNGVLTITLPKVNQLAEKRIMIE
jgi:HSP20 family protein